MLGRFLRIGLLAVVLVDLGIAAAQQPADSSKAGIRGEVVSVDSSGNWVEVKGPDGKSTRFATIGTTQYLGVEPGRTSLEGAVKLNPSDMKAGDKVWARGTEKLSDGSLVAKQVIVMSATAIASRNERDANEWRQRGMFGEVKAIDPAAGTFVFETRRGQSVNVKVDAQAELRRLQPGSVDAVGATPMLLTDIKVGDQLAVRALSTADPANVTADRVIGGDFPRRAGGSVTAVDAANGTVTVTGRDGQAVTLAVSATTLTRQFTPPQQQANGGGSAAPAAGQRRPEGGPGWGRGGMMGFGLGGNERAELEKSTQPLALTDLAAGDFVFAVSEPGKSGPTFPAAVLIKVNFPAGQRPSRGVDAGSWDILPGSGGPN